MPISVSANFPFSLLDVWAAVNDHTPCNKNLIDCFAKANLSYFDPNYNNDLVYPANSLNRFRNYAAVSLPTLTTNFISAITSTTATCGGNISSDGGTAVTTRGVCWGLLSTPTIANSKTVDGSGIGSFISSITGLSPGTTYYVRAYATTTVGTGYGNERSFMASIVVPTVISLGVSPIASTTATNSGNVTNAGGGTVTERGSCWSLSSTPTIANSKTIDGSGLGLFTSSLTGLSPYTLYYVRTYATNSAGTGYGSQSIFPTQAAIPIVVLTSITNVTNVAASYFGQCTYEGGQALTGVGVQYKINGTGSWTTNTATYVTPNWSGTISGLSPSTTYDIRVYGTNSAGTGYSSISTFVTLVAIIAPTVTTTAATNIAYTTVTSGGNVTSDGGSAVTARGVCWSTGINPTTASAKTSNGTGIGSFTSSITGLSSNTLYYIRAYATNGIGTSYGLNVTFTTLTLRVPIVTTGAITNITPTTANTSGDVTDGGGTAVTSRGVCWSTSTTPTIANSKTIDGSGTGGFASSITGLTQNTIYYVRAYATNTTGTGYGNEQVFTSYGVPTLLTTAISGITTTTASSGGNTINAHGGTITSKGICWNTIGTPTTSDLGITNNGSGTADFTSSLTGLSPGITYYVRAYAVGTFGTGYGNQLSFTTSITLATLTTTSITNITTSTASSGGNITNNGGSAVTARGVCWSTVTSPTIANSKTTDGSGSGSFTSALTGLSNTTTYYVRAYATNGAGTAYGNQISFLTGVSPTVILLDVSDITNVSTSYTGQCTAEMNTVTAVGVYYRIVGAPSWTQKVETYNNPYWGTPITGLTENSNYQIKVYATNSIGTSESAIGTFTTLGKPTLNTTTVTSITNITAVSGGNTIVCPGGNVLAKGVCWSTITNPTTLNSKTTEALNTLDFSSTITGLSPSTLYYVRAYCTNDYGTGYGNQITFITGALPTLLTNEITNILYTEAISGGVILTGTSITAKGVCWNTSGTPTIAGNKTNDGIGTTPFESLIAGLTSNTTYYVRAYATNSTGTGYGNELSFITATYTIPVITGFSVYAITGTTFNDQANVISDGGSAITARGFIYSTTNSPTSPSLPSDYIGIENKTGTIGVMYGYFGSLTGGTTYYVRPFATNTIGTGYSAPITVVTLSTLTLTTTAASAVTTTTATSGGNITNDGGLAVTNRGVCWNTTGMPDISLSTKTSDGSGTGIFTSSLSGLIPWTDYYVRAFATNSNGTSYGNEIYFTTPMPTTVIPGSGKFYNGYVVFDARGIAAPGWHVPTVAEWNTLINYIGGASVAGGKLKSTTTWAYGGNGTDNYSFTALPAGSRSYMGAYFDISFFSSFWTSSSAPLYPGTQLYDNSLYYYNNSVVTDHYPAQYGKSIRLIKDDSTPSTYTGNDGVVYATITINGQVWMAENLAETKFANMVSIPNVTNDSSWAALTTSAWSWYDNYSGND